MNRLKSDYLNHEIAQYIMTFSQYKKPSVRKNIQEFLNKIIELIGKVWPKERRPRKAQT